MYFRSLVFVTVCALPVALAAQSAGPTSKGNALVGGTASVTRSTVSVGSGDDESTTFVQVSPTILYFVAPRLGVGGTFSYGRASGDGSTSSSTTIGPEIRFFLAEPSAKAQPFLGASVERQWSRFESNGNDITPQSTRFGAVAGVIWMVTRQVGISSEAFYQRSTADDIPANAPDVTTSGFGLRFGFAAFLMR